MAGSQGHADGSIWKTPTPATHPPFPSFARNFGRVELQARGGLVVQSKKLRGPGRDPPDIERIEGETYTDAITIASSYNPPIHRLGHVGGLQDQGITMKSERRHELEKNVLADRLGGGIQAAQPIMPLILGGLALLIVGSLGWAIYSASTKSRAAAAWTDYYFNLTADDPSKLVGVADDFPSSTAAGWARQTAGASYLQQGLQAIYRNRAEGEKLLNQAIEAFEDASVSTQPELKFKAIYCLAQAQEALGQLDKAAENFELVSKSAVFPALADDAKKRLDFISSDSGRNFYRWFDKLDPKPDAPIELPSNLAFPPTSPGDMQFDPIVGGLAPADGTPTTELDPANLPPLPGSSTQPPSGGEPPASPDASVVPPVDDPQAPAESSPQSRRRRRAAIKVHAGATPLNQSHNQPFRTLRF